MLSCSLMASCLIYATNLRNALTQNPTTKTKISQSASAATSSQSAAAASSAAVQYDIPEGIRTDCPPGKRGIVGWENEIRSGKSYMWCGHDNGRGSGIAHIGNDKLSYLSVPPGMKVTVYENNDMGGLWKVFEQGEWDLRQHKFDWSMYGQPKRTSQLEDRASSLKIEGVPVDASTPATSSSFWNMNR